MRHRSREIAKQRLFDPTVTASPNSPWRDRPVEESLTVGRWSTSQAHREHRMLPGLVAESWIVCCGLTSMSTGIRGHAQGQVR
jgi:hypothetical protein